MDENIPRDTFAYRDPDTVLHTTHLGIYTCTGTVAQFTNLWSAMATIERGRAVPEISLSDGP
jgi:hypothetical protein